MKRCRLLLSALFTPSQRALLDGGTCIQDGGDSFSMRRVTDLWNSLLKDTPCSC